MANRIGGPERIIAELFNGDIEAGGLVI